MTEFVETPYEDKQIRCPRLGGPVTFAYCRVERGALPCHKAIHCWFEQFDAEAFFRNILSPEQFEKAFSEHPAPKIVTLIELIEQARELAKKKNQE
jgi:hypothetical protein